MKRRVLCRLCAILLCLILLVAPMSVGAVETPCFMAVNDNLLALEDRFIPILVNGVYYMPYQVLDKYSTGLELGVFPIHNTMSKTLTIYSKNEVLTFDLTTGACEGRSGNSLAARAVFRNGQIYVPVLFLCNYFDLSYLQRYTSYGPLIRICNAQALLDDDNFVGAAELMMGDRLRAWRNEQAAVVTPTPTPTPKVTPKVTPTPTATTPTPAVTPTEPVADKGGVGVYLAFRVEQTDTLDSLLARLEFYGIRALFFFPADALAGYDETVRRVLCDGHIVGLTVSGSTAEEIREQTAQGNRILAQIAYVNTYTILPADRQSKAACAEAEESGLLCWQTDVDARAGEGITAQTVEKTADRYEETVFILADTSQEGAALIKEALIGLNEQGYTFRLAVETELKPE